MNVEVVVATEGMKPVTGTISVSPSSSFIIKGQIYLLHDLGSVFLNGHFINFKFYNLLFSLKFQSAQ